MDQDEIEPTIEYAHRAMDAAVTNYLLKLAESGKVLFYPDCAVDWQPMGRMTDLVRGFVFCKQRCEQEPKALFSLAHCPRMLRSLLRLEGSGDVDIDTVRKAGLLQIGRASCRERVWTRV